jgi:integrase
MFPDKGIAEFTDGDMAHVAKSFQPAERRMRVAAWRSFFKWAVQTRRIVAKPTDALPTIKRGPKKVYDIFSDAEAGLLTALPVRDGALFEIMLGSGPRKGDCRNFRLRDWRADATPDAPYGRLIFREGKGGKDRQVPATEPIARKLSELAILDGLKASDFLWYTRPGGGAKVVREKPIGDGSFDRWWYRCLGTAGVRASSPLTKSGQRNPHLTRHTFATRFLRQRGRLETLQLILGHDSIQTPPTCTGISKGATSPSTSGYSRKSPRSESAD